MHTNASILNPWHRVTWSCSKSAPNDFQGQRHMGGPNMAWLVDFRFHVATLLIIAKTGKSQNRGNTITQ